MVVDREREVGVARDADEAESVALASIHVHDRQVSERTTSVTSVSIDERGIRGSIGHDETLCQIDSVLERLTVLLEVLGCSGSDTNHCPTKLDQRSRQVGWQLYARKCDHRVL